MSLLFIDWNIDPVLFAIPTPLGELSIRYYSILYAMAFWFGYLLVSKMFKREKCPDTWADTVFLYMLVAVVVGARLGHVIFYGWDYYSQHPLEILQVWKGGLASHGGAIGILIALYIFNRRVCKKGYLWILDHLVIPIALAGFLIRTGNLFNSEICGSPTDLPWAFRFLRLHASEALIPRHPTQIYEALYYLCVFGLLSFLYWKRNFSEKYQGAIFGIFLVTVFGFRMLIETIKMDQEDFEADMVLNMGQILSIPFVIVGIIILTRLYMKNRSNETK